MSESHPFVSRGGLKLGHALDTFALDVNGLRCADLGASTGGFTDCLLRAGAASVVAVDTAYGVLAWTLRNDARVTVIERTNALHAEPPEGGMDLVVLDMGWTPQRLCIPAALRWLRREPGRNPGRIVSLIKPHYELSDAERRELLHGGVLVAEEAERIAHRAAEAMPGLGARVLAMTRSPILGGATRGRKTGNAEFLCLLEPA